MVILQLNKFRSNALNKILAAWCTTATFVPPELRASESQGLGLQGLGLRSSAAAEIAVDSSVAPARAAPARAKKSRAKKSRPQRVEPKLAPSDVQFFGDLYISHYSAQRSETTANQPAIFEATKPLLNSARFSVVNLEGVVSGATFPLGLKRYLLRMPLWLPPLLARVGINAVSLANNHSMDFGYHGLFDTQASLDRSGVDHFGAGADGVEATRPLIRWISGRPVCFVALNRTLPTSFWARKDRPGSAYLSYGDTRKAIRRCRQRASAVFAIFHWGGEGRREPRLYQRELAHLAIDAGATAVIGHHPHILQPIEAYRGRPIFYSIGNYAFASYTRTSAQEGLSVRVRFVGSDSYRYDLVPLQVLVREVGYAPKLFAEEVPTPVDPYLPPGVCESKVASLSKEGGLAVKYYSCVFSPPAGQRVTLERPEIPRTTPK